MRAALSVFFLSAIVLAALGTQPARARPLPLPRPSPQSAERSTPSAPQTPDTGSRVAEGVRDVAIVLPLAALSHAGLYDHGPVGRNIRKIPARLTSAASRFRWPRRQRVVVKTPPPSDLPDVAVPQHPVAEIITHLQPTLSETLRQEWPRVAVGADLSREQQLFKQEWGRHELYTLDHQFASIEKAESENQDDLKNTWMDRYYDCVFATSSDGLVRWLSVWVWIPPSSRFLRGEGASCSRRISLLIVKRSQVHVRSATPVLDARLPSRPSEDAISRCGQGDSATSERPVVVVVIILLLRAAAIIAATRPRDAVAPRAASTL